MSSSRGNCLDPLTLGVPGDLLRYAICKLDTLHSDSEINQELIYKLSGDYLKEYVNLLKRVDGVTNSTRQMSLLSDLKARPDYHKHMKNNDLSKSLEEIHLYYQQISKRIEMGLQQKTILRDCNTLYAEIYNFFEYLQPITPRIAKQIKEILKSNRPFMYNPLTFEITDQ